MAAAEIARARELRERYPFAAETLDFYVRVAGFEGGMPGLLAIVEQFGPAPLALAAATLRARGPEYWRSLQSDFWTSRGSRDPIEAFFAKILLQPRARGLPESPAAGGRVCPACHAKPVAAVLRPEGHGARRALLCSLCGREWPFPRAECPACGESDSAKLPVYTAEQYAGARVEACETCRTYLKCIDLTRDGRAVPVVDELALIPLDLWARERRYTKLEPNLFGI